VAMHGDYLAFSSVFDENIYNYSAVALKDSVVCMIDKTALRKLFLSNPEFAMEITKRNCKNEAWLLDMVKTITYKQMRGKLASTLIYLSSEQFIKQNIFQSLTRKDIADFASITTESSIKFIKEFEKEGILNLNGKNITISNLNMLEEIAKNG
jgi:CRP/FNR family transcriptional regulator